jgi:hypothetical protein
MSQTSTEVHQKDPTTLELENISINPLQWTAEEEKKLVRKIDLYFLPCIWLMYLLSYVNKTK